MISDRVVAFVDILGFQALINRMADGDMAFAQSILRTLELIRDFAKKISSVDNGSLASVQVSWFSDSVVLSAPVVDFWRVALAVGLLSSRLCLDGILVRGGIVRGLCHHEDDICFGPALVEAYKFEKKTAIYPRIVVVNDLANDERKNHWNLPMFERILIGMERGHSLNFTRDEDGFYCIDYLSGHFAKLIGFDGRPGKTYVDYLRAVRSAFSKQLTDNQPPDIRMKLCYFASYFNRCAFEARDHGLAIEIIEF